MSEKLKIKISIANRVYPLTILPNQEQGLRIAAQKIEKTVKKFIHFQYFFLQLNFLLFSQLKL